MTELPFRATTAEACHWLAQQTGRPWTLASLIEAGLIPYVWLDYDARHADLFGDANGGYAAPVFYEGDTQRLANGASEVLITITKDVYKIVARLPAPGFRRDLHELRFARKDLEQLLKALNKPAAAARESRNGIGKDEVLIAFNGLLRINLEQALADAGGIFGDDGARVKGSAKKGKHKALWNPVTLALGMHDVHRVPLAQLKRAFKTQACLADWKDDWERSLALLGH